MKLETFFRIITIFGFIALVVFVANAASATQLNEIDWDAKFEWSSVGHCGIHDRCLLISNLTTGVESHRSFARPRISSKVIRIEKKERKPIKVGNKIKSGGKEFDKNDPKAYDKFWTLSLEEQKKYPLTLRRKFIHTRRARRMRAEEEKLRAKNPKEFVKRKRVNPTKVPYTKEEIEILGTDDRRLTASEKLSPVKSGKVSNQSKIGNKVMILEVK